jgi:PAS domain S-box-containing protein
VNQPKFRLISKTESAVFVMAFAALIVALILSLFLAQHFLVNTARYWDFLRIERYLRLCQMALEAESRAWPSEKSLQKLRDIGLYPDLYPPDHEIPQPNPRYVSAIESVEIWGHLRDAEGKPTAVIRLSRHDINTRHTFRTVRLYTLIGAIGGTVLIGIIGLVLHKTIIRSLRKVSGEIKAHLPQGTESTAEDPLEELEESVHALLDAQAEGTAKLRRLLGNHTEMACTSTPEGTLLEVNEAYCRFFGRSREQLVGSNYLDLIPPADRSEAIASVRKLSPKNPMNFAEHRVLLPDGSTRWMRWRDTATFDVEGNAVEILSFGLDVTPEKDLVARIEGLRIAFDQMQSLAETGSLTWDFGADRMEWTPETRRLLGVGTSVPASMDGLLEFVAPDEREIVRRLFSAAREEGRNFQHEFRAVLPDGSLRVLQSRAEVLADAKTKLLNHLTCTLRDITALRDAEAANKRELRFREAIEQSLAVGIAVRDMSGRTLSANPAFTAMVGFTEKELISAAPPAEPYWPEEDREAIRAALASALEGRSPKEGFQLVFCRKDGSLFDALVSVAPLLGEDGNPRALLGAVTDISAIQNTRRELLVSNERLRIAQDVIEFGIWDWDPVADTLFWDRASFAMFGHPNATDPRAVWKVIHSEEEQERLTYELKRLIAAGGQSGQDRLRARWSDGSVHEILSTYVIIRDAKGKAERVLGVNRDVTAETEEEQELLSAQERLAAAIEGGSFGTFEHVFGVGALNWNMANYEIHGIDPSITDPDELFRAWKAVVGPEYAALEQKISGLPVSKNIVTYTFGITVPGSGDKRRIHSSVFVERNKKGHPVRLVGISRRLD